jgi:hypothetical protein
MNSHEPMVSNLYDFYIYLISYGRKLALVLLHAHRSHSILLALRTLEYVE